MSLEVDVSPIDLALSIFSGLHISLTYIAIGVALLAAAFLIYGIARTK